MGRIVRRVILSRDVIHNLNGAEFVTVIHDSGNNYKVISNIDEFLNTDVLSMKTCFRISGSGFNK